MAGNKEILINLPISLKYSPQIWNWTKHFNHDQNITTHHIEIHDNDDELSDDDVRSIIIVIVGTIIMLLMWMVAKYSKEDRPHRCVISCIDIHPNLTILPIAVVNILPLHQKRMIQSLVWLQWWQG